MKGREERGVGKNRGAGMFDRQRVLKTLLYCSVVCCTVLYYIVPRVCSKYTYLRSEAAQEIVF